MPPNTLAGLSLRDLEYAVTVAELRHFGRAAERCGVSQPALSEQIRKLEGLLGVQLFNSDVYMLDSIPALVDPLDVTWTAFWALLMSCIASLPPSWRASRIDPVEALRYE